jgi:hypothetical protein
MGPLLPRITVLSTANVALLNKNTTTQLVGHSSRIQFRLMYCNLFTIIAFIEIVKKFDCPTQK